jgi:hypothetical protein
MFVFPKTPFHLDPDSCACFTQSEGAKDTRKKSKERERRKSIIQAVSDFFHKKKESSRSPSPPKIPLGSIHSAKDKFPRFRLNKHKDKGKVSKATSSLFMKRFSVGLSFKSLFNRMHRTINNSIHAN